jgi:hypothetical protein
MRVPSNEKYASAFSPPNVSWRMFDNRVSRGSTTLPVPGAAVAVGVGDGAGSGDDPEQAATAAANTQAIRDAYVRCDMRRMITGVRH